MQHRSSRSRAVRTFAVVGLALSTLIAACGDDSSSGSAAGSGGDNGGAGTSGGSSNGPSCKLASAAEVGAALGVSGLGDPDETKSTIVTICTYALGDNDREVTIRYETEGTHDTFEEGKAGFTNNGLTVMDLAGVGEEAYSNSLPSFNGEMINTIVVLAKGVNLEITSHASIDAEVSLAKTLIAKL